MLNNKMEKRRIGIRRNKTKTPDQIRRYELYLKAFYSLFMVFYSLMAAMAAAKRAMGTR